MGPISGTSTKAEAVLLCPREEGGDVEKLQHHGCISREDGGLWPSDALIIFLTETLPTSTLLYHSVDKLANQPPPIGHHSFGCCWPPIMMKY